MQVLEEAAKAKKAQQQATHRPHAPQQDHKPSGLTQMNHQWVAAIPKREETSIRDGQGVVEHPNGMPSHLTLCLSSLRGHGSWLRGWGLLICCCLAWCEDHT